LKRRIQKLDEGGRRYTPENCPGPPNRIIISSEGEPPPPIPADGPPCRCCGGIHVRHIVLVVVKRRAEAEVCRVRKEEKKEGWVP
jgi:hypothetical protein